MKYSIATTRLLSSSGDRILHGTNQSITLTNKMPAYNEGSSTASISINFARDPMIPLYLAIVKSREIAIHDQHGASFVTHSTIPIGGITYQYIDPKRSQASEDDQSLKITTQELPEKNRISLTPKNEFTYLGAHIQTDVSFYPDTVAWAGKGKTGQTVDTQIAKPAGSQKLGW